MARATNRVLGERLELTLVAGVEENRAARREMLEIDKVAKSKSSRVGERKMINWHMLVKFFRPIINVRSGGGRVIRRRSRIVAAAEDQLFAGRSKRQRNAHADGKNQKRRKSSHSGNDDDGEYAHSSIARACQTSVAQLRLAGVCVRARDSTNRSAAAC